MTDEPTYTVADVVAHSVKKRGELRIERRKFDAAGNDAGPVEDIHFAGSNAQPLEFPMVEAKGRTWSFPTYEYVQGLEKRIERLEAVAKAARWVMYERNLHTAWHEDKAWWSLIDALRAFPLGEDNNDG